MMSLGLVVSIGFVSLGFIFCRDFQFLFIGAQIDSVSRSLPLHFILLLGLWSTRDLSQP